MPDGFQSVSALRSTAGDGSATRRGHTRDESVIDHLARELYRPKAELVSEKAAGASERTETELSVEDQLRKEGDPRVHA